MAFVGFESALEFWRDDSGLGLYTDCVDPDGEMTYADECGLSQAIALAEELEDRSVALCEERPLDLIVPYGTWTDSALVRLHRVRWKLPRHSFVRARQGVLVASPELVFLEAAADHSLVELLKLGMELCGTYALDDYHPDGFTSRRRICTVGRIKRYLSWCKGAPGIMRARAAAGLLMDGSNSPLETNVMLGLTLPPRHRGIGLRKPVLNERRDTTELQAETIGTHTYFYDARWSGTLPSGRRYSVDCEVDSKRHFNNPNNARADVVRKDNVQFMRSTHVSISSEEFADARLFMKKGLMIAKLIGQRVRRYPRRGSEEARAEFEVAWERRVSELGDLLRELGATRYPTRRRPGELRTQQQGRCGTLFENPWE